MAGNRWQRDEQLLVFHLYCHTPFGRLHQHNPEIVDLARRIGRTPSAVAMKACNFSSLDPALERRGLSSASQADRALWASFLDDSQAIALEAEALYEERISTSGEAPEAEHETVRDPVLPTGATEVLRTVKARRVQRFFRHTVMSSYENRCALTGMELPELLIASHIIPWSKSENRRADPTNGLALNALYDKAFDLGLITFDERWRAVTTSRLKEHLEDGELCRQLLDIEGRPLNMPTRFRPDENAMEYHRSECFKG